jgi:tRNA A-37 threonylcarbamoyl transferase component Bud32
MSASEPKTIGRYNVERLLGAGGMGAVYLAEDPLLKRRLAVKVVHAGTAQQDVLLRFRREAEISARLNHPNVITIYDVGEDPAVGPFIAMEFVDGASLSDLIRGGSLRSSDDRLRSLIAAAHALEAAHAAGIVHRDIKPGNLMVGRDGRVKLMDFGVARGEDTANLTMTGSVIGTPAYIAPEELRGTRPSASTDRYAFSVMTFEVFTGSKPYAAPDTSTLLYNIAHEPPVFPEGILPPLRTVFERALAKDPAARFPDLRSFLAAVIEASISDPVAHARLLEALPPEDTRPQEAVEEHTLAIGAAGAGTVSEGMSAPKVLALATGGIGALVAAVVALYIFGQGSNQQPDRRLSETPATVVSPIAATSPLPPAEPAKPTAEPDDLVASVAPSPAVRSQPPPPATLEPEGPPVSAALLTEPAVEPTAGSPRLASTELRDAVRSALSDQGMKHVEVRVDGDHHLTLANLRDTGEAERARAVAARATSEPLQIDTSVRSSGSRPVPRKPSAGVSSLESRPPEEAKVPPAPAWQIHREGSEKTD